MFVGVVGAAISIFTNLDGLIKLAKWAKLISYYWHSYLGSAFSWVANLIGLEFPPNLTGVTAFCLFIASAGIVTLIEIRPNLMLGHFAKALKRQMSTINDSQRFWRKSA